MYNSSVERRADCEINVNHVFLVNNITDKQSYLDMLWLCTRSFRKLSWKTKKSIDLSQRKVNDFKSIGERSLALGRHWSTEHRVFDNFKILSLGTEMVWRGAGEAQILQFKKAAIFNLSLAAECTFILQVYYKIYVRVGAGAVGIYLLFCFTLIFLAAPL